MTWHEILLARLVFRRAVRARVWRITADLLESGMELHRALPLVADLHGRGSPRLADLLAELRSALRTGRFASAVAVVVPEAEAMLFARFGSASDAALFRAAARLTNVDARIAKAIRQALMWPVVLFVLIFALLFSLGSSLFPTLTTLTPLDQWPASSRLVGAASIWVADNILLVVAAVAGAAALYKTIESRYTGRGRSWLDRLPPFSLYRLRTGATFAFVLIENARVGHEINRAFLLTLAASLPPYTRSRIRAIAERADRTDIGTAAALAGTGFPDSELNAVLRAYATSPDWVPRFSTYADAWLERLQERVDAMVQLLRLVLMVLAAAVIGAAAWVMVNITSLVQ